MSCQLRTTSIVTATTVAAASLLLGALPASAAPAQERAAQMIVVQTCPRIDDLADQHRAVGFSPHAAKNYAEIIRRDCLDEAERWDSRLCQLIQRRVLICSPGGPRVWGR